MKYALALLMGFFVLRFAQAADLDWSGLYRVEANEIRNTRLGGGGDKEYVIHHLILKPKIVAFDGFTIYSRFDIFNASGAPYSNSQIGQVFGDGVGPQDPLDTAAPNATSGDNSSVMSNTQRAEQISVTNLYLNYTHEFGSLIIGRAPLNFGLGITYNSGEGMFDHWLTTRDMIAYKVIFGNISVTPMLARVNQGSYGFNEHTTDYLIQAMYENPETNLAMGVMYQMRQANYNGNDAPAAISPLTGTNNSGDPNAVLGGPNATLAGGFNSSTINFYVAKQTEHFQIGFEGSILNGKSGVSDPNGNNVSFEGYGLAFETEWRPDVSKWKVGAKFGYATGDNPNSTDKFEGYVFNRNYDVALLLFNYPLGQADFLRTSLYGGGPGSGGNNATLDTEAISNVFYLAPYVNYDLNDRMSLRGVLATGFLNTNPLVNGTSNKNLGFETDVSFNYRIKGGIFWSNTVGLFFPGGAFQGDQGYQTAVSYGLQSKAAIRF